MISGFSEIGLQGVLNPERGGGGDPPGDVRAAYISFLPILMIQSLLGRPPAGLPTFQEAVVLHVRAKRDAIAAQCTAWMKECKAPALKADMERSFAGIRAALGRL